ncbi:hypothetical protein [Mesorhizobium sp. Pch-S]|uniref:hypothetical protein n=1 Tax=Mesorhizobium sp. Pch-S TaxID=2082387 RepID=UPI0010113A24|nr:hypothetical protein [Mesorhizobium sp. Pch-S]
MLNRRTILTGAPALVLLPVPSPAAENAAQRVQRLCRELSDALDEWTGGDFMAEVFPASVVLEGFKPYAFDQRRYALDPTRRVLIDCARQFQDLRERDA